MENCFIERLGQGVAPAGEMSSAAAEMVIGTVAHALQAEVDTDQPIISGELPIGGHRFEGLLPPIVAKPAFHDPAPGIPTHSAR